MPLPGPQNTTAPAISGSGVVGNTLTCSTGTWTDFNGTITSYSYQWYRNGSPVGGNSSTYGLGDGDDGGTFTCNVTALDNQGQDGGASSSNSVHVVEPAPTFNSVSISGTAKVGSTLSASASINHMGGAAGSSSSFTWQRNGSDVASGSNYTLTGSDDGATITVRCGASNSGGSASATSGGVGVTYPAPVNTVAPAISGTARVGQVLTCDGGSWNTTVSKTYQWQRDASGNGVYSNIAGQTAATYTATATDVGCHLRCVVTASNDGGTTPANSTPTALVVAAPVNTVAPNVTGTAKVGQTLTTDNGTWLYSPTSYAYFWQRDTQGNGVFGNISGATASTYVLTANEAGCQVRCLVIATNANGNGQAPSNASARVQQPPFLVTAPKITDPNVFATGTVTCDGGTWGGYPTPSLSYQWESSPDNSTWSNVGGATGITFTVPRTLIGDYIRCQVTADNGVT